MTRRTVSFFLSVLITASLFALPAAADDDFQVEVLWGGTWWTAEIVEERCELTKIHYVGWDKRWDEWVEPERIREIKPRAVRTFRVGDTVDIEWQGTWWAGSIIQKRGQRFKVHYTGWGAEWDEWVTTTRLR